MQNSAQPTKVMNPLWMISLFFSFTEIALGYAVFNVQGGIQIALTAFVIGFPLLVAAAFFGILWFRPAHLYAPKDFASDEAFERSIAFATRATKDLIRLDAQMEQRIFETLTSEQIVERLSSSGKAELKEVLKNTAADITSEIRATNFVSVSLTPIAPELSDLNLPLNALETFSDFVAIVYYALENHVPPYTYGTSWVLRDRASHKIFRNMRMIKGLSPGKPVKDSRSLGEVGIEGGMSLEAIPPEAIPSNL